MSAPDRLTPTRPAPRIRLDYLDGLRGLAALYVVMHHAYFGLTTEARLPHLVALLTYWLYLGHGAVDIFIVLSGYCLMLPVVRAGTGVLSGGSLQFFKRRARRILPPYYAAMAVTLLGIALVPSLHDTSKNTFWSTTLPAWAVGPIVSHLLLVHNFFPAWHSAINYPMWSVATEWQIYFLFPLLLLPVWRRFGAATAVLTAFVVGFVPLILFYARFSGVSPQFLGLFALGMAAADLNFSPKPRLAFWRERLPWGWLAGGFLLALVGISARGLKGPLAVPFKDVLLGLATACLLVYCTRWLTRRHETATDESPQTQRRSPLVLRAFESRPAVLLGVFSYSLYLMHAPILAVCQSYMRPLHLSPTLALAALLGVGVPLAVALSYLFHLAFERPFLSHALIKAEEKIKAEDKKSNSC